MNCLHCSTAFPGCEEHVDELTLKEIEQIISDFHALGGKILEISGGSLPYTEISWILLRLPRVKALKPDFIPVGFHIREDADL